MLRLSGEGAEDFLHNYTTSNIQALEVNALQTTSCCNRQGRVVADLDIFKEERGYRLVLHRNALSSLQRHLNIFLRLARLTLEADAFVKSYWLRFDQIPSTALPKIGGGCLGENSLWLRYSYLPEVVVCWTVESAESGLGEDGDRSFQALEIVRQRSRIIEANSGKFLPQVLGFEALGAIDYDKGCYLGQEIIARTHSQGKLKSHSIVLTCNSTKVPEGAPILDQTEKLIGRIINSSVDDGKSLLLAVVKTQTRDFYLEEGTRLAVYSNHQVSAEAR